MDIDCHLVSDDNRSGCLCVFSQPRCSVSMTFIIPLHSIINVFSFPPQIHPEHLNQVGHLGEISQHLVPTSSSSLVPYSKVLTSFLTSKSLTTWSQPNPCLWPHVLTFFCGNQTRRPTARGTPALPHLCSEWPPLVTAVTLHSSLHPSQTIPDSPDPRVCLCLCL